MECPAGRSDEKIDPCENGQWKRKTIRTHLGFLTHDLLNDQSSEYCIGPSWPDLQGRYFLDSRSNPIYLDCGSPRDLVPEIIDSGPICITYLFQNKCLTHFSPK